MKDKIQTFAELVENQTKDWYIKMFGADRFHVHELNCKVTIKSGKKYTKVDVGRAGKYMVDADGNIFGIKAYGVIHMGKKYGNLDTINGWYWGDYDAVKVKTNV